MINSSVNLIFKSNLTLFPDAQEIQLLLAGKLYEKGLLSIGQAAQMAGFSKRAFMELLGHYLVSVLNYPADEIGQDFENA